MTYDYAKQLVRSYTTVREPSQVAAIAARMVAHGEGVWHAAATVYGRLDACKLPALHASTPGRDGDAMSAPQASAYAVTREDTFGAAALLQQHETALRALFDREPRRAAEIRAMASALFEALDDAHHDATSGA
jgi:hypothetical protein